MNSIFLKIQDIAIFAAKFHISVSHVKSSQISEIGTEKISNQTENTGNLQIAF